MTRPNLPLYLGLLWIAAACAGSPAILQPGTQLIPINGTELFVKRVGAGKPILIVHGGPILEHGYLVEHLAPLSARFELIFYDQRLSGRSAGEVPADSVRLDTFVDDIEALRVALDLRKIHLIGHSWGGLLAMRYAIKHGDKLRSLILLDSVSASSALWQAENQALAKRISAEQKLTALAIRKTPAFVRREPAAIEKMLLHSFELQFHDPSLIDKLQLYVPPDYSARSRQFGAMGVDLKAFDFHQDLESVEVPTLVLFGAAEPGADLGGAALHRHLPRSKFIKIPAAGHFPFVEQPAAFAAAVLGFLDSVNNMP